MTINATDNGTVASRQRSTDGGVTWVNANNALTVSTEGITTVLYRATDNGGNVSEVGSVTIKLDKTAPTVTISGAAGERLSATRVTSRGRPPTPRAASTP